MPIVLVLGREWNTSWICFMVNIKQVVAAVLVIVIIARLLSRTRAQTRDMTFLAVLHAATFQL